MLQVDAFTNADQLSRTGQQNGSLKASAPAPPIASNDVRMYSGSVINATKKQASNLFKIFLVIKDFMEMLVEINLPIQHSKLRLDFHTKLLISLYFKCCQVLNMWNRFRF